MRPKQQPKAQHDDLFRARLNQIINMKHDLIVLADKIDQTWLDTELIESFSELGRPAEPVRFIIGMFLLKHTSALSHEQLWDRRLQDPYFQYLIGEEFFQHELRHERSGMSHWRKRIGDKLDILLAETGRDGDQINAVMSAVGYNLRLILRQLRELLHKIIVAIVAAIIPFYSLKSASLNRTKQFSLNQPLKIAHILGYLWSRR